MAYAHKYNPYRIKIDFEGSTVLVMPFPKLNYYDIIADYLSKQPNGSKHQVIVSINDLHGKTMYYDKFLLTAPKLQF